MTDQIQSRLLKLSAGFLFLYALILSISPAARERSWFVTYRWSHWLGLVMWVVLFIFAHYQTKKRIPDRDPYLLPIAAFISGLGLLTIWRLSPEFGSRQTIWLAASIVIFGLGLRFPNILVTLHRYKYLWLISGIFLTGLTFLFGSNPAGGGPRLWLGCCGIYFQPSEPLKLFLIIYLAAYLADSMPLRQQTFPLIFPTVLLTGFALLILLIQRDLGTASIFILLYATILFLATGLRRVLLVSAVLLMSAGLVGYFFINIVHLRIDAWLDPWLDPSGHSYQIIQSLMAVANGGLFGRGPGLGSPSLVPIAHSDFIFAAIAEETGLVGTIGLLVLLIIFIFRSLLIAINAPNHFRRLLIASLTAYLGIQSLLIIGGNLRLLPLTGVTLPFISYGGSSLVTAYLTLLFLLLVSNKSTEDEPAFLPTPQPYLIIGTFLIISFIFAALYNGWWAIIRGPDLLTRTDNPRRAIADRYVPRGELLDRNNTPINITQGVSGSFSRKYMYINNSSVNGYTHSTYGQAGLEASLDPYLRGLQGNPASLIWWNHLVYGQPPPGLDVRLSLDLEMQKRADYLLDDHTGAIVLINAQNGDILIMASHPTFDPNYLDEEASRLSLDPRLPLLNRAAQGVYFPGDALKPLLLTKFGNNPSISGAELQSLYNLLGFYNQPHLRLPVAYASQEGEIIDLRISPLQMVLAAATLSNAGTLPAPRIALAVDTPQEGWVILPALSEPKSIFFPEAANKIAQSLMVENHPYWQYIGIAQNNGSTITWYLAGTLPGWQGTPLALVILIEENNPASVQYIGQEVLEKALGH